jgi:hypothetical protein
VRQWSSPSLGIPWRILTQERSTAGFGGVLVVAAGGYLLQVAGKSNGAPTLRCVNSVATLMTPSSGDELPLLSSSTSAASLVSKLPKEGAKGKGAAAKAEAAVVPIEDDDDDRR